MEQKLVVEARAEVAVAVAAVGLVREAEVCSMVAWVALQVELAVDDSAEVEAGGERPWEAMSLVQQHHLK